MSKESRMFWKSKLEMPTRETALPGRVQKMPVPAKHFVNGARQGHDGGPQYRSGFYVSSPEQRRLAEGSRDAYQRVLKDAGYGPITTEILDAPEFYYAEDYHQQYLAKNPMGYCGLGGTGVACPTGLVEAAGRKG